MNEENIIDLDPAILKEIDKINHSHCEECPCMKDEIDKEVQLLSMDSVKEIKNNALLKQSPSASLDVLRQNTSKAIDIVSDKHKKELCQLQSNYAIGLWNDFSKKYNMDNPEVRILVGRIIVSCVRAYKMSGSELLTYHYDKEGNSLAEIHPYVVADRNYSETISKLLMNLDELQNGKKITIKTELPDRKQLFGSNRYIIIDAEDEGESKKENNE